MKKRISIEDTADDIAMVLSIAPEEIGDTFNGRTYILIDDYHEPDETDAMIKAYPVYVKSTQKFMYIYEHFFETINTYKLKFINLNAEFEKEMTKIKLDLSKAVTEITNLILEGEEEAPEHHA